MTNYEEMSLIEFIDCCGTKEQCREKLFQLRWSCEKCSSLRYLKINGHNEYYCKYYKKTICTKKATIMKGTKKPISIWFYVIFLMSSDKREYQH